MALTRWTGCLLIFMLMAFFGHEARAKVAAPSDIYVIIYATYNGKTGHAGIAFDRYVIKVKDCATCKEKSVLDTVATGELTYYDLWPAHDDFQKSKMYEDGIALYHRLPYSSSETPITVSNLIQKGIRQLGLGPCDAIIKIPNTALQDFKTIQFLEKELDLQTPFNLWRYNCADFVKKAVEHALKIDLEADEIILFDRATTPNSLFKALRKIPGVRVIKDPGNLINGSFLEERILKRSQK